MKISKHTGLILLMLMVSSLALSQTSMWDKPIVSSQEIIDSLETRLPQLTNGNKVTALNAIAEAYWELEASKSILYGQQALDLARQLGLKEEEGYALINICQGYLFNDAYDQALDFGLKSLKVREEIGDQKDIAFTLRTLGWLYYDIGYLDHAEEYHYKVLNIHKELNDDERIAYSYNSLGLIFAKKNQHQKAISHYTQSLELKRPYGNRTRIAESLKNIGISYTALTEFEQAEKNLNDALRIIDQHRDHYDRVEVLNELGYIEMKRGNFSKSEQLLDEARKYIDSLSVNKVLKERNYLFSSELYAKMDDHKTGLLFLQKYDKIQKEILSDEKQYRLAEMRVLYEAERRENEITLLKHEKEVEALRKNAFQIGIVLTVLIGLLIVNRLYSGLKKNKKLYELNQNLSQLELEKEEIKSAQLKDRLEYRKKELTNMGLLIAQRNETYHALSESLRNFDFLDREDADRKIKSMIKDFEDKLKVNEDVDDFYSDVEQLHDDYFFRLKEKFPNLTDNDMKLAAQLRLNLSSKEISSLNNISVKSVEISRYRLRKKLQLDPNDILTDYLQNI